MLYPAPPSIKLVPNPFGGNAMDVGLLEFLVCPLTRSKLRLEGDTLVSAVGGLKYPIRDGIPVLLVQEAQMPEGVKDLQEFKARYRNQIPE